MKINSGKRVTRSLYARNLEQENQEEKWNRIWRLDNAERRRRMRSMNFEEYASEGSRFIREVSEELCTDRNHAARITRAVLHALRDRLPASDAIQFAQGLPMALKAIFIDQYDISRTPVVIRHKEEFLEYIYEKDGRAAYTDFPDPESVHEALRAVFLVLGKHMSPGQVRQVKGLLNREIAEMTDHY